MSTSNACSTFGSRRIMMWNRGLFTNVKVLVILVMTATLIHGCGGGGGGGGGDSNGSSESSSSLFKAPFLLFAEDCCIRSASGLYTVGDDRILLAAVGDFDGNGFDDVLMTFPGYDDSNGNKISSEIRIYRQNTDGTLEEATNIIVEGPIPATQLTRRTFVADFNGDGTDDVFLANHGLELPTTNPGTDWHEPDTLLLSTPNNTLVDASTNLPANDFYSHGGAVGDIDNDGDVDILTNTSNWPPPGIQVYINDGSGNFTLENFRIPQYEYLPGLFTGVAGDLWIELIDANNDGYLDLFKAGATPVEHYIALNDGNGDFTKIPSISLPALFPADIFIEGGNVADLNMDGLDDLLVVNTDRTFNPWNHELQLLISNGDGTFNDETFMRLPSPADITTNALTYITDLNQDGKPDILNTLRGAGNPLLDFYVNDGIGNFERVSSGYLQNDFPASYHPIDLGNDGDIDFVISGFCSDELDVCGAFVLEALKVPDI